MNCRHDAEDVALDSAGAASIPVAARAAGTHDVVADQGGTITLQVDGFDEFGHPIGDVAHLATVSSSVSTDVISGLSVSFPYASPHVLTVTVGSATETILIEVTPTPVSQAATQLSRGGIEIAVPLALAALTLLAGAVILLVRQRRSV